MTGTAPSVTNLSFKSMAILFEMDGIYMWKTSAMLKLGLVVRHVNHASQPASSGNHLAHESMAALQWSVSLLLLLTLVCGEAKASALAVTCAVQTAGRSVQVSTAWANAPPSAQAWTAAKSRTRSATVAVSAALNARRSARACPKPVSRIALPFGRSVLP